MGKTGYWAASGQRLFAMVATLLLVACASASISSTRDPSFTGTVNRVFIVLNQADIDRIDPEYTPALVRALRNEFFKKRIAVEVKTVNPLALDDTAYAAELQQYQPNGVLTIKATSTVISGYGGIHSIVYDASLFSPQQPDRRIWRAQITADGGTAVIEKKMRLVAEELLKRLRADRLIS